MAIQLPRARKKSMLRFQIAGNRGTRWRLVPRREANFLRVLRCVGISVVLLGPPTLGLSGASGAGKGIASGPPPAQSKAPLKQSREDRSDRKKLGLHEVGPEEFFPQTEAPDRPAKKEKSASESSSTKPSPRETPTTPVNTPAAAFPSPTITIQTATPAASQSAPPAAGTQPAKATHPRWQLFATLACLAGTLLALVFVSRKLREQLRIKRSHTARTAPQASLTQESFEPRRRARR
jgi:hypothetical protein